MMKKAVILEGNAVSMGNVSWDPVKEVCDAVIYDNTTEEEKWDRLSEAEIVLTNKVIIDHAVLDRFPNIKYIGVCATGYNVVDVAAAEEKGIVVTNVPAYSTDSVVQLTIGFLINLASKIKAHDESVHRGEWADSVTFSYQVAPSVELVGKTLGIYGFGSIGRGVAEVAQALGMNILVYTAHPANYISYVGKNLRFCDETSLFRHSDFLTLHCPMTEETADLICKEKIALMKDGAMLINVSRGGMVNEEDLAEALRSGKLAGAAIDVVKEEPLRTKTAILDAPNLIITPHIGWATKEARDRLVKIIAENIKGWEDGMPVHVVHAE